MNTIYKNKKKFELIEEQNEYLRVDFSNALQFRMKSKKLKKALSLIEQEDKAILMLRYQDDVSMANLSLLLRSDDHSIKVVVRKAKSRIAEVHNKL
ncbi:hypothetical protein [Patiriisocius sp. Uisw_017]|uniref:hypothetical protein n=1 Tax=Patiriisocius sp. Uisw_017 TaxID=3230968 RepID=UPI0039E8C547